jgi:mannose-6-phosphate isomerase-like protein (cupin superfamily)
MAIEPFVKEFADSTEYQSLLKPPKTFGLHSGRVYLKSGADCGQHTTGVNEEMLVFLSGSGQAIIGDKTHSVGIGKITYIPPQTTHNIKNTSDEPLIYIFCVAPAGGKGEK